MRMSKLSGVSVKFGRKEFLRSSFCFVFAVDFAHVS